MLTKVWNGEALGQKYTTVLIDIMHRCRTGKGRLPAGLPPGTKVAHKTGTFSRLITNDAGIITLPGKSGHVVVTVQIKESSQTLETQERAIAEVGARDLQPLHRQGSDEFAGRIGNMNARRPRAPWRGSHQERDRRRPGHAAPGPCPSNSFRHPRGDSLGAGQHLGGAKAPDGMQDERAQG